LKQTPKTGQPVTNNIENQSPEPEVEKDYNTGKLLCTLGVIACGLLMFTLPLSKVILAADMFTHFSLHYMVAGGACLAGFFMPRWHWQTAVALTLAGMVMIGYTATHKSQATEQVAAAGEQRLKLMTFNTWLQNKNWRAVVNEIISKDPDVVTLLEFGQEKAPLLAALKGRYPYQVNCQKIRSCHMAVLSRYPFVDSKVRTRWRGPPYVRVRFGKKLANLNLFAIHTIRPPHFRAHLRQINAFSAAVNDKKGLKIVMGDFNSTPFSRTLNAFANKTKLKRITSTPSWPALFVNLPQIAIDHIFVSPKIKVLSPHRLGNASGSDHFPVNAIVSIPVR